MTATLPVLDPLAAFVDVGSEQMYVSIAGGPPEVFGTVTTELHRLRDWLKERGVKSIALEATGVYWLPLYGVLETAGSEVVALGGFYRRMAGRRGGLVANLALARKLAEWFWRVMVKGVSYVEQGLAQYEAQVLETKRRALQRLAKQLGQIVVPSLAELQRT